MKHNHKTQSAPIETQSAPIETQSIEIPSKLAIIENFKTLAVKEEKSESAKLSLLKARETEKSIKDLTISQFDIYLKNVKSRYDKKVLDLIANTQIGRRDLIKRIKSLQIACSSELNELKIIRKNALQKTELKPGVYGYFGRLFIDIANIQSLKKYSKKSARLNMILNNLETPLSTLFKCCSDKIILEGFGYDALRGTELESLTPTQIFERVDFSTKVFDLRKPENIRKYLNM